MIRKLSAAVAARIAAGEVVERPSSVVKELVENAIDAGARRVSVEVQGGGIELIRVADDGCGIAPADLPIAFERHATSKLQTDADLERIETLGFRGEALPSIAAVADVDCVARVDSEPHAWQLAVRGGIVGDLEPAARTAGTTITVRELFAELPARRKFLRGRSGEAGHITTLLSQLALAFPDVQLTLTLDGRRTLASPGDGDLRSAVEAVHGRSVAAATVPILPDEAGTPDVTIAGCLGLGAATLPTRAGITLLVNRRWVQHRSLSYALDEAYRTLVPVGRHPIVVLDLRVPPTDVDVNVHPRKAEVRLLKERTVFAAVQRVVRHSLAKAAGPRALAIGIEDGSDRDDQEADGWRSIQVLGQAGGTYIIAEGAAGLYLVDQHAAHERVLLERLRESSPDAAAVQALLEPAVVELSPREATLVSDHVEDLRALGFDAEPFGERALLVRSVPAMLADRNPLVTLRGALASLADEAPPADWRERLAVLFACHNAVRAGDRLTTEEMAGLLEQLGETELCQACSHGRPTAILITHGQLAREFGRT